MNNSRIALEPETALKLSTEEREAFLIRMIDAIKEFSGNLAWKTLHGEVYMPEIESLERRLMSEAKKSEVDIKEIYRLQGRLAEIKRFNLESLLETFKVELENIKKRNNESN